MVGKPFPPAQWQEVKSLFDRASRLPAADRDAVIATATDPAVEHEVKALLAAHDSAGGFLEPTERVPLAAGDKLGPYEIVERLGGGGMGDVYRARDLRLARDVALKVLRDRIDPTARSRFEREARAIAALSHPNVLAIYDVGEASSRAYLVTELLAGETLRARLARKRPTLAQAIDWTIQLARGLSAAHAIDIVHRDLKPENVHVQSDGTVRILDFGLARSSSIDDDGVSTPGAIVGTVGYLAPEQARGMPVTPATDLFALGAILFEMLTGTRAFRGDTPIDTLRAVIDHEPPAPSSIEPSVPPWLDRVVASLLAKDPALRFESARDLVLVMQMAGTADAPDTPPRSRRRWAFAALAGIVVAVSGFAIAWWWPRPPAPLLSVARPVELTHSGHDRHPAMSPDGKFLAFTSDREGRARIWLQQIDVGRETPLTEGPDSAPRFSPDGSQIMFTRATASGPTLYRVDLLGGEPRKIVENASDADWSPDGKQVAFARSDGQNGVLVIAAVDGSAERVVGVLEGRVRRGRPNEQRVRWSPDGKRIAVTGFRGNPGSPQSVTLVPVDGSAHSELPPPYRIGLVSAVAWDGPDALIYSQALSVNGNTFGSPARIVRHRISTNAISTLLWPLDSSFVVDRWPGRGIVFDSRSAWQTMREIPIAGGQARTLSEGSATDRQPRISPDGSKVIFTSSRGGTHLDIWVFDRATSRSRRLTDHPADDWDPALSVDGKHLLWSSNRTGVFEVWMAEADGSNPRQVTHDGVDAENPTATADGTWIVYTSGAPGRTGTWRVRADGSEPQMLVADVLLPEASPDGQYVLFLSNKAPGKPMVGVATIADGRVLPFEIRLTATGQTPALLGRARWTKDGKAIAFVGQDETGATGIFQQDFAADGDTTATRRKLAGFDPGRVVESFDVDDASVVLAESVPRSSIVAVTDLGL